LTFYLSVEQIEAIHSSQIKSYGGSSGLRDRGALEVAAERLAIWIRQRTARED
jgi:prophage maintenance system killer protein